MRIALTLFLVVTLVGCGSGSQPDGEPAAAEQDKKKTTATQPPKPDKKEKPNKQPKPKVQEGPSKKEVLAAEAMKLRGTAIAAIKEWGGTFKLDETTERQPVVRVVLSFRPITDAGLEKLKGLPHLKSLHLRATSVTDAGLVHLKGLKNLQEVILNGTLVTDAGEKDLQTALPNCVIRR